MAKTETETLIDTLNLTRDLSKFYLKQLEGKDIYQVFEVNDVRLNSIVWLIAHITVSQNWLLLVCTGGERIKIPWARQFGMGSEIPEKADCPPFDEILSYFDKVHQHAVSYISQLTDEDLEKPTTNGVKFGGEDSVRAIIKHAIRHEGAHAGQLGWLCKLHGIKNI